VPYLSADDILKRDSFKYDELDVPEWGGTLRFRTISGADRDRWAAAYAKAQASDDLTAIVGAQARLISLSSCDAEGKRIFSDEQVSALNEGQSGAVLQRVFTAISALNKIDTGALETEGKDSPAPESSGTDSVSP
jgi:hypothetical protein